MAQRMRGDKAAAAGGAEQARPPGWGAVKYASRAEREREGGYRGAESNALLESMQRELEAVAAQERREMAACRRRARERRRPILEKRQAMLERQLPFFWLMAFLAHPVLEQYVCTDDQSVLNHLTRFWVEEGTGGEVRGGGEGRCQGEDAGEGKGEGEGEGSWYELRFTFDTEKNPFFHNETLWKRVTTTNKDKDEDDEDEDEDAVSEEQDGAERVLVTSSEIRWKDTEEGRYMQRRLHGLATSDGGAKAAEAEAEAEAEPEQTLDEDEENDDAQPSLFAFFDAEDRDLVLAEIFRNEIFPNPLKLFRTVDFEEFFEEENDEEEEEEEEGDGEGEQAKAGSKPRARKRAKHKK